jgi:serine/threonine protein kinase
VHRDVTPENIMITFERRAKVIDFGVAKAADAVARTMAGALKGKYPYMAPELIEESEQGLPPSPAVDVYALGVVLYELITGRRPFRADNELALIRKITTTAPEPPESVCPGLPAALSELVMKAMARSPADRFASAGEMKKGIEDYFLVGGRMPTSRHLADYVRTMFPVPSENNAFPSDEPPSVMTCRTRGPQDPWQHDSSRTRSGDGLGIDLSDPELGNEGPGSESTCPPPPGRDVPMVALPPPLAVPTVDEVARTSAEAGSQEHDWDAAVSRTTGPALRAGRKDATPGTASDWFDEGLKRWRDKDFDGTLACWTQALALDPENRRYQSNLRKLQRHLSDRGRES